MMQYTIVALYVYYRRSRTFKDVRYEVELASHSSPRRMPGAFADAPTWRENGIDVVASGWRGMMGAHGLTRARIAYWETVFRQVIQTPEWQQELKDNHWAGNFENAAQTRRRPDIEYAESKVMLGELGIVKR